ncbi:energy-coupling factor transporter transmembrane protein EcfT [Dermabacter jinjuensis]|nr:energy-coupling factor transporter transmembrane protein EcfT [Dermabacter jinjuensis]
MELRGFGRGKRRTWYGKKLLTWRDWLIMALSFAVLAVPIVLAIVNGGRFWNPFA